MNMREKIARALCELHRHDPDELILPETPAWVGYLPEARTVLEALREPDERMVQAGNDARDPNAPIGPNTVEVWQAMLSAAGGER